MEKDYNYSSEFADDDKLRHITTIHRTALACMDADSTMDISWSVLEILRSVFLLDSFSIVEYNPVNKALMELLLADTIDGKFQAWEGEASHTLENNPLLDVFEDGEAIIELRDEDKITRNELLPYGDENRRSASLLFAPIRYKGKSRGVISIQSYEYDAYTRDDLDLLVDVANVLGMAFSRIKAEKALKRSESIYRQAIAISNGVPYERDFYNNRYTFMGEGIFELTGYSAEEFSLERWESIIKKIKMTGECSGMDNKLAAEKVLRGEIMRWRADVLIETGNGEQKWLSDSAAMLTDENGKVCGALGILQDISERKRNEEEKLRFREQMQRVQKMESLGIMAGGIAHNFNNLLMAIMGNTDLIVEENQDNPQLRKKCSEIQNAAEKAAELSREMLAYSGQTSIVREKINLNKVISNLKGLIDVTIPQNADMDCRLDSSDLIIEADESQIRQLVMNLVSNAAESLQNSSEGVSIITGKKFCNREFLKNTYMDDNLPEGEYVFLTVSDDGVGMNKKTLENLFDPFFTTKFTGRGLGMPAVLGIVRSHNGAICISTARGAGTEISVHFPSCSEEIEQYSTSSAQASSYTILIAEDEDTVRNVSRHMLEMMEYNVVTAVNGKEALQIFQSGNDIDLIILDLTMPVMSGKDALEEIRKIDNQVPVIISSGYNQDNVLKNFDELSINGFIQKPFRYNDLAAIIKRVISEKS